MATDEQLKHLITHADHEIANTAGVALHGYDMARAIPVSEEDQKAAHAYIDTILDPRWASGETLRSTEGAVSDEHAGEEAAAKLASEEAAAK